MECLVKERRDLRKRWRKGSLEEMEGISLLQTDLKECLERLQRVENLRFQCTKERARTLFYKDPFRFVKELFTKEKSGVLQVSKRELEDH